MLNSIAILGRPNVGKSSLFNKLTKSRNAIVSDFSNTDNALGGKIVHMHMLRTKTGDQETVDRLVRARAKEKDVVTVTEVNRDLEVRHPVKRTKSYVDSICKEDAKTVKIVHFVIQAHASNSKKENAKMKSANLHTLSPKKAKMAKARARKAKVKGIRTINPP